MTALAKRLPLPRPRTAEESAALVRMPPPRRRPRPVRRLVRFPADHHEYEIWRPGRIS